MSNRTKQTNKKRQSGTGTSGSTHEQEFNMALGDALRGTTARWNSECILSERQGLVRSSKGGRSTNQRIDILVNDQMFPPTAIECSYTTSDAEKDAVSRLGVMTTKANSPINTAIAVHVDKSVYGQMTRASIYEQLSKLDKPELIRYALYQSPSDDAQNVNRWPEKGFIDGTVRHLAELVKAAAMPKERIEEVATSVASVLTSSAEELTRHLPDTTRDKITSLVGQSSPIKGMSTTMVLWLNALLTQQRLHQQNVENIPALPMSSTSYTGEKGPLYIQQVNIWNEILEINWRAIFAPAIGALQLSGDSCTHHTNEAIVSLFGAICKIESARMGSGMSIGAELFPKLSEDRKRAAAYYTQAGTAELLAMLTIRDSDLGEPSNWANPDLFDKYSLGDLACGTGTLLRAGYQRILSLHESHGGNAESVRTLHRGAMEKGLVGTDVSPIAAHLTSSGLAAVGTGEAYGDTRIGWLSVGKPIKSAPKTKGAKSKGQSKGTVTTGSLEFLEYDESKDLFDQPGSRSTGKLMIHDAGEDTDNEDTNSRTVDVENGSLQWMLMNPPYSRTRRGQSAFDIAGLDDATRNACQDRWGEMIKELPVTKTAGMAASFLALAQRKICPGGRIGFVLPLTAAFSDTWECTRQMIESDFEYIMAIAIESGQALGRDALSADTGMEEMMLVATRRSTEQQKSPPYIRCVSLQAPITRQGLSGETARAILAASDNMSPSRPVMPITIGKSQIGSMSMIQAEDGKPWSPLGAANLELDAAARHLHKGHLAFADSHLKMPIPMTTVGELFKIGPTHHLIGHLSGNEPIGAFELFDDDNLDGSDKSLWSANAATQTRLEVQPTHKGIPYATADKEQIEHIRSRAARTFYARNMRWTSQALLVASTNSSCMGGSAWLSLSHPKDGICRAFALWANSTLGMLIHWSIGQRTHSGRSRTQLGAINDMPCPDLASLSSVQLKTAVKYYNSLKKQQKDTPLLPACQAHCDGMRKAIDTAIADIIGFDIRTGGQKQDIDDILRTTDISVSHDNDLVSRLRKAWCKEPSVHGGNRTAIQRLAEY